MKLTRKIGLQQTNLAREHSVYLSPNLLIEEACGLPLSATMFKIKMRSGKINIAVKVFQRTIMICILNAIGMPWMFSKDKNR